jgi:hypothetical protein
VQNNGEKKDTQKNQKPEKSIAPPKEYLVKQFKKLQSRTDADKGSRGKDREHRHL